MLVGEMWYCAMIRVSPAVAMLTRFMWLMRAISISRKTMLPPAAARSSAGRTGAVLPGVTDSCSTIVHPVLFQGVPVERDPEPRGLGQGDRPVHDARLAGKELSAKRRLGELNGQVFDVRAARRRGGKMSTGGDANPALPAMGHDREAAGRGEVADLPS